MVGYGLDSGAGVFMLLDRRDEGNEEDGVVVTGGEEERVE